MVKNLIKQPLGDLLLSRLKYQHCSGFTLLEILIALLIFSMVITGLFYSFKAFVASSESIKNQITLHEKLIDAMKRIDMDIKSIFILQPPRYKKPEFNTNTDVHRFIGYETDLGPSKIQIMSFSSFAHVKFGTDLWNGVSKVTYYLKLNEKKLYDFHRSDINPPFTDDINNCSDPILIRDVTEIEIIYKDRENSEYNYWDSDSEEFDYRFPSTVGLKVTYMSKNMKRILPISSGLITERKPIE